MCGICGIIGSENRTETTKRLDRMMRAMKHRGPDGEGMFVTSHAGIGMRRLSIIDLPGGQQPIWNEAGTLAVVFNGEIYNFRELRRALESEGHVFRTQSDTEVMVHAYEKWASSCVQHLHGMFAFAIVEIPDGKAGAARRVFLARDKMGIKPLYYGVADGKFSFASEVRALLASGSFARCLSASAVSSYLLFGAVGEPVTLIDGIYSVPPGYCGYVSCDAASASFALQPYWNVTEATSSSVLDSRQSPAAQVRSALHDSVKHHLIADVPLGIFLSSGIDSTAIAAVASRQHSGIKTFTVAFSEERFSEGAVARTTAKSLGTDHSELLLTADEMHTRLDEAVAAFDQPSADGINTYFVSWAARQAGLKVALSGLGSDELFGGYSTFSSTSRIAMLASLSRYMPRGVRKAASAALFSIVSRSKQPDAVQKANAAFLTPSDLPHPYFFARMLFPPQHVARFLRGAELRSLDSAWRPWLSNAASDAGVLDSFTSVSWLEIRSYLASMLLRDTDSMSMCHSLEVRVPFLDDALVRTVLSCPATAKDKRHARKALLIEAVGDLLPTSVIDRPKRTFTLP
ncbi:MAG TPA: asparagine synthase (glutamine-hydrolyzing), partial [Candidatus Acidoferrales bacterium]|nr:asparagine synthase (glutamine-hydrolyzing) [Candidatus Acidoferrales bacterium]